MVDLAAEFDLLGEIEVRVDGHPVDIGHARQRCVLVALLVEANRPVPVEQLLDRVWGDRPPQRARSTLYSYVSRLRQVLATADGKGVVRHSAGYLLAVEPMALDVHRFRRLVAEARATEDGPAALALFERALAQWRGDAFATLDTPWLNGVREALNRERLAAELDRNDLALGRGDHVTLLGELSARVVADPLDERLSGQLMLALFRGGRQAEALDHYQRIRRRLADELGVDPGAALRGLHQQILTADARLAVPARAATGPWPGPGTASGRTPVPRQLPAPPRSFTGRMRELAALDDAIDVRPDRRATVVISAIGGAGGIGKTWLAVRWAYDNLDRFPDGQLYVDLRGFDPTSAPVPPAVAVRAFLDALGVTSASVPVDPDAQAALYRSIVADKRLLIVLDNARESAQVTPLLPGTPSCAVLITSRRRLATLITAHGARPIPLDVLTATEARHLLTHHLGPGRVAAEPEPVTGILRHCAGLPLALGIVAARAAIQPELPLAALAEEMRAASGRLDALDAGELAVNLRAVLACSYRALTTEAALVFRFLGLAPGPDIGLPAAASLTGLPTARAGGLLRELADAHLLHEHAPSRYRMHDLVRLYAAEQVRHTDPAEVGAAARRRILDHYLHTGYRAATLLNSQRHRITVVAPEPGVVPEPLADHNAAMAWFDAEHHVLLAAIEQAAATGFEGYVWQLAWAIAEHLDRRGHWHARTATQRTALDAARRQRDPIGQAHSHRGLGGAYAVLGRYEEAQIHLRQGLDLFGGLGDDSGKASTHLELARVFERQSLHREALEQTQQALQLFRTAGHQTGVANALNGIGWLHTELGDHRQALSSCQQALELHQAVGHRRGEAFTWDSLGYAHHHLGHHERATACYRSALELYRALGDRYREAETLGHLGDTREAAGELRAARLAWQQSVDILDALGHPDADQVRAKLSSGSPSGGAEP